MIRRIHSFSLAIVMLSGVAAFGLAIPLPTAHAQSTESARFKTPSGNINCEIYTGPDGDYGNCLVKNDAWKNPPSKPADCDLDWDPAELGVYSEKKGTTITNEVYVGACRGDIGPLCGPDECSILTYGKSKKVGRITCTSAKTGITCVTNQGRKRGFTMKVSGYTLIK